MKDKLKELMSKAGKSIPVGATHFNIVNKTPIFYRNVFNGTHDKIFLDWTEWHTVRDSAPRDIKPLK